MHKKLNPNKEGLRGISQGFQDWDLDNVIRS